MTATLTLEGHRLRAVAVDVDGTLAGAHHEVTGRTTAALRAAQDAGMAVVLVTGRALRSALRIARAAELRAPVICCNGALTVDGATGEVLREVALPHEEVVTMLGAAEDLGLVVTWWAAEEIAVSEAGEGQELLQRLNQQPVVVRDTAGVRPGTVLKAMFYGTKAQLDAAAPELRHRLPRLARSMDEFFELSPATASKWQSLARVLEDLGVPPEECLGFGDGENDVPWLREIGFPVAVANARDEVKAVALRTTGHHAEDGVADFLERILG